MFHPCFASCERFVGSFAMSLSTTSLSTTSYSMASLFMILAFSGVLFAADDDSWVVYQGKRGIGYGKHIVWVSGDEEYRSEEALPMMARIMAFRYGFKCTVLFAIDPETGVIDPNNQTNIPGMSALDDADLMVLALRFRELPDSEMKHLVDYVKSGKPVIGLRTSTHAFNYSRAKDSPYATWSFNNGEWKGGFGQQVLGDTWISHHGGHKSQATRGMINPDHSKHPILNGVKDVFGPTDVYGIRNLPDSAEVLLYGAVLSGMKPTDPPVEGPKNDPMMPVAWVKTYEWDNGNTNRIFNTTMGASVDLECEDLRRLLVNACLWCLEMADKIPEAANVDYVGEYKPTFYGFTNKGFWKEKNLRPADFKWPKE